MALFSDCTSPISSDGFSFLGVRSHSELTKVTVSCYSLLLLFSLILPGYVTAIVHDDSFIPDAILRVTAQTVSVGGIQRLSTLINGSIPGPELRVPENEVAWIRVFNDINGQNLTMVS